MTVPGFTAEAGLYRSARTYRPAAAAAHLLGGLGRPR